MTEEKKIPEDGINAFYEGFDLDDNPFSSLESRFDEWDSDFMEAAKNYKEEGRVADGTFN